MDIVFNATKSTLFKVGKVSQEKLDNLHLGNNLLCWCNCLKYLGIHFYQISILKLILIHLYVHFMLQLMQFIVTLNFYLNFHGYLFLNHFHYRFSRIIVLV